MKNSIDQVEEIFDRWIFQAIKDLLKSEGVSLGFLIMACAIDYLAGLEKGGNKDTTNRDYKNFLKKHTWFSSQYDCNDIYNLVRCGLAHNFSLKSSKYALTHNHPEKHLKIEEARILLNYENFFNDIKKLKAEYFASTRKNQVYTDKLIERVNNFGFLGPI